MNNNLVESSRETVALNRSHDYGETLRQLNEALEERIDLKERRIAHLEDDNRELKARIDTQVQLLDQKRNMIATLRHRNEVLEAAQANMRQNVEELMVDLAEARRALCAISKVGLASQEVLGAANEH